MTATFTKLEVVGFDSAAYERFIRRQAKAIQKAAKVYGNECSDEQARQSAESLAAMYRHQFRVYA
jgi:TRAP-type C4-dicarboxylate transport system substrate-binding protein